MQKPPQYQQPPPDPNAVALDAQAQNDQIAAVKDKVQMDTASLMARYGTRLALAQSGGATGMANPISPLTQQSGPAGSALLPTALNIVLGKVA